MKTTWLLKSSRILIGLWVLALLAVSPLPAQADELWVTPASNKKLLGNWATAPFKKKVGFSWHVPDDMVCCNDSATIFVIALKDQDLAYQIDTSNGVDGDPHDAANVIGTPQVKALVAGELAEISVPLPSLVAGDYVSVQFLSKKAKKLLVVGLRYTYDENLASGGAITGVTAGFGLSGGGSSGTVTLNTDSSVMQRRVTGSCPAGQSIRAIGSTGTVTCETDDIGTGDITGVTAGTGLLGGGSSGTVTLSVNSSQVQTRVSGFCPAGQSIRVINANGTVTCELDNDTNTNAATICPSGTFLNGDGSCDDVTRTSSFGQSHFGGGSLNTLTRTLISSTRSFCALTEVRVENTDTAGEFSGCRVAVSGANWILQAILEDRTDDANVICAATCFTMQ